jgi:chemotaxis signal transduction protein
MLERPIAVVGAGSVVPGVFAFRGAVLGLHDPGVYFGGHATPPGRWVLVVEHGADRLGLIADEVEDVVGVPHTSVRPPPLTFGARGPCVAGVVDDDVLVLRPPGLFDEPSFHLGA